MSDAVCSYFNVGYCKHKDKCSKIHESEECQKMCKNKTCLKRHRRPCKDKENCKFLKSNSCEFTHEPIIVQENQVDSKIVSDLRNFVTTLLQENNDLKEEMKKKSDIIDKLTADLENLAVRVQTLEEAKVELKVACNQCDFQAKNKKGLENHTRRMHKNDEKLTKEVESHVNSAHEIDDEDNKLANNQITYPRECDVCKFKAKSLKVFMNHMLKAHKKS